MRSLSRRQLLAATVGTGSAIVTAGCVDEDEQSKPQSNIVTEGDSTEMGCVERVETTGYDDGSLFISGGVELTVELIDGHGYGKAIVEWTPIGEDSFSDSPEYEQAIKTIERGDESVSFDIDGPPEFVHLTTHCDGAEKAELVVEVKTETEESANESEDGSEGGSQ